MLQRKARNMKIIGVIPVRMESSRFPGNPLADIQGMPMIGHCYHRAKMHAIEEFEGPNEVKVVVAMNGDAIYFSQEVIPLRKKGSVDISMLKQARVISFRSHYLDWFNSQQETAPEKIESVDMLRMIENGDKVRMVITDTVTYIVDTSRNLEVTRGKMSGDSLIKTNLH